MKKKILIIDDETDFSTLLQMRLEACGFKVDTASDGTDGLRKAREAIPDLILLDIMMPGLDGGEVAHRLKQDSKLAAIPVIFLTAAIRHDEAKQRREGHDERFLSKTCDVSVLLHEIRECLGLIRHKSA